ncbi:MAG: RluA family pseudouridine synthase [Betaproteobacteria bacterium]|nr:MAG: RluA family pseudouridine synthase [Betaproteobacteria bacterium]
MSTDYRVGHSAEPGAQRDLAADTESADTPWSDEAEKREAIVADALHGSRLDKAVVAMAGEFSRNHLQGLIESGHVWVDGRSVTTSSRKVMAGQRVAVELIPTAQSQAFRPEPVPLDIVFEDAQLLVLNKPAGLVVHPAAGNWSGTVLNGLLAHHNSAALLPRAGIVHRLDKDTSGLMVVGKTLQAMTALVRAIAAREVHREYLAIAHGVLEKKKLRIEAPIARDPQSRIRMAVLASGKSATTDVERLGHTDEFSALRCTLHTGRTHQIRVHLASRGHPLVADAIYGGAAALGMQRQALHATRLALTHPADGTALEFRAVPPADFDAAWNQIVACS